MLERGMSPSHPGVILSGLIQELRKETGDAYTITEIAEGLGVNRKTLSQILNKNQV
ncbi:hypothetical protein [Dyadobacter koreensis]|uniref:hypothetical protein n=1 Tax=Dyadobacter koreensis TaxID=408657 RepID=UPI0026A33DFB|nr:hypothetical protein [Dyadobacter koreensis]